MVFFPMSMIPFPRRARRIWCNWLDPTNTVSYFLTIISNTLIFSANLQMPICGGQFFTNSISRFSIAEGLQFSFYFLIWIKGNKSKKEETSFLWGSSFGGLQIGRNCCCCCDKFQLKRERESWGESNIMMSFLKAIFRPSNFLSFSRTGLSWIVAIFCFVFADYFS